MILRKCDINSFNLKNLCNLERHKCKTAWKWHRNVETWRSIYYIKRYSCDIKCAFVGCQKTIFTSILWDKLEPFANTTAGEYKAGFKQAWSTMDQTLTEKQILGKWWKGNIYVIQIYTDFQQACESIDGAVTTYCEGIQNPKKNLLRIV
jgi:hypothetical protein